MSYYIVSVKHTLKRNRYITFWRPDDCGYAWPLSWAGKYDAESILSSPDYYNNGESTIAVSIEVVDAITTDPRKGDIDGNAGPVVLNNADNWKTILAAVIAPPLEPVRPKTTHFGRNSQDRSAA